MEKPDDHDARGPRKRRTPDRAGELRPTTGSADRTGSTIPAQVA
jgi:hypothetical protein